MTTISQLRADLDAADTMSAEASEDHLMTEEISLRHWNACNDYVAALRAPLLAEIERLNIRYFEGPTRLVNRKNAYRYIADHDAAKARLDLMRRRAVVLWCLRVRRGRGRGGARRAADVDCMAAVS